MMKHPETPNDIADSLEEWFENGQGALVRLDPAARLWFERGRARFTGLTQAIRDLPHD